MKLHRTAVTVISAAAVLGGLATASPASAATTGYANAVTKSSSVVTGKIAGFAGNRHQFVLTTVEGKVASGSKIRSYYCPSGASISPTWASSKCTLRSSYAVRNSYVTWNIGSISSTGRSATQLGPVMASSSTRSIDLGVELKLFRQDGDPTTLQGTVGNAPLQVKGRTASFYMSR